MFGSLWPPCTFLHLQTKPPPHLEGQLLRQNPNSFMGKKGWKSNFFVVCMTDMMHTQDWVQLWPPLSPIYSTKMLLHNCPLCVLTCWGLDCQCGNVVMADILQYFSAGVILQVRKDKLLYFKRKDDYISQRDPISVIFLSRVSNSLQFAPCNSV